mmetsp:Transcript_20959/g.58896  ORF Transcript_20959/g.58896 Transcript_20959/m.58896 type:complete len:231 (+) Transcript_20959:35-727(+)
MSELPKRSSASAISTERQPTKMFLNTVCEIVPVLSMSIRRNCWRQTTSLSAGRDHAIMESTARWKSGARVKARKLFRSCMPMGGSMALLSLLHIHRCRSADFALGLRTGSKSRSASTNPRAGSESRQNSRQWNAACGDAACEPSGNGGVPTRSIYTITPSDHRSALSVYEPDSTSGAMYGRDPHRHDILQLLSQNLARPKSMSLRWLLCLLWYRKFSGFRSRCTMLWECR